MINRYKRRSSRRSWIAPTVAAVCAAGMAVLAIWWMLPKPPEHKPMACLTPDIIIHNHNHNNLICSGCDKQWAKKMGQEQKEIGITGGAPICDDRRNCELPGGKPDRKQHNSTTDKVRSAPAPPHSSGILPRARPQSAPQQFMPPVCGMNYVPEPGSAALFGIGAAAMLAGLHLIGVRLT